MSSCLRQDIASRYSAMKKYVLVLKNEKAKTYTTISWLILALNFIAFLYIGISGSAKNIYYPFIAAGLLILIFTLHLINKRNNKSANNIFSLLFTAIIIAWIIMPFYWAAAINFFLFIIQDITTRSLVVLFFEDRIMYPSFPKRTILWQQLNNIILKDGVLTIDCKNNRVFQNEIVSDVNEAGFNEFCNQQLKSATTI